MNNEKLIMNKGKRRFFTLLTAICFLFIVVSCSNEVEKSAGDQIAVLPPGMGAFLLYIEGQDARTIMPSGTPDFAVYKLEFTGEANVTEYRTVDSLDQPVYLLSGTYNLFVTAYTDEDKTKAAAWGEKNGIEIETGMEVSCVIPLNVFIPDGSELGTFSWNINFPADLTKADMKIKPLSAAGSDEQTVDFPTEDTTNSAGYKPLKSGYYEVQFTFEKPNTQKLEWLEILHVYQNMVSTYTHTFGDEYFNNILYTVTFVFNDESTPDDGSQTRLHGSTAAEPGPAPNRAGYTFGGWYTVNSSINDNDKWNFATQLSRSIELYARWYKNLTVGDFILDDNDTVYSRNNQSVTVRYDDADMNETTAGEISVYYSGEGYAENTTAPVNTGTYNVTVTTAGGTMYAALEEKTLIGTLVITPKELTITDVSAVSRPYNGGNTVELQGGILQGIIGEDNVGFTLGTGTMVNANAGDGKAVAVDIQLTGEDKDNYILTQPDYVTVDIGKAEPVVAFPASATLTYGQTLSQASLTGQSNTTPGVFSFNEPDTMPTVAQSGNFLMTFTPDDTTNFNPRMQYVTVTVNKAAPVYTLPTGLTSVYGNLLSTVTLPTGWEWDDGSVAVGNAGSRSFAATFTPDDTDNYNTVNEDVSVNVTQKELTITGVSAVGRPFNGGNTVALQGGALEGIIDEDDVGFTLGTGTVDNANAGNGKAVTTGIQLTWEDKDNYTLTQPDYVTVNITNNTGITFSMENFIMTDEGEGVFASTEPVILNSANPQETISLTPDITVIEWSLGLIPIPFETDGSVILHRSQFNIPGTYTLSVRFIYNGTPWLGSIVVVSE